MERQPTDAELDEARARARSDARAAHAEEQMRPAVDAPVVEDAGPYEFAPEDVRAEYERAYEETLSALRARRS